MFTSETHSQSYLEDYTVSLANHLVALIFYYLCSVRECLIIVLLVSYPILVKGMYTPT